jgi:peptidoglycan hydrolase-like protein with peptidoglycan-binding domain
MKMMPYGVAAALLLGGSLLVPQAQAWQSGADSQSSSLQPGTDHSQQPRLGIRDLQQELKQAGLYRGPIDGVWGPESRSAMEQFQRQHGLSASGQLDHDTLQAMRSDDSVTQSGGSGVDSSRDLGIGGSGTTGPRSDIDAGGGSMRGGSAGSSAGGGSSDEEQR